MGKGRQTVKPTGGPERGGGQSQCQGVFLWAVPTARSAGRGQVKQGRPHLGALAPAAPVLGGGGGEGGHVFATHHWGAMHLCGSKVSAEQPVLLFPKKAPGCAFSLKHRVTNCTPSPQPSLNICLGTGPSEHKASMPSRADVPYKSFMS